MGKNKNPARKRYDRISSLYNISSRIMESAGGSALRKRLWDKIRKGRILEIGVGTGENIAFYPPGSEVYGIDISPRMIKYAGSRAASRKDISVELKIMDAENLSFESNYFDTVVTSYVFCSVPDPVRGLREASRVCRPGGRVYLLEHVRKEGPAGYLMDILNPFTVTISGANINRRTVENVEKSGLKILKVESFLGNIIKIIEAKPKEES